MSLLELSGLHAHYGVAWPMGGGLSMGNANLSPHPLVETDVLPLPARAAPRRSEHA